MIDKYTLRKWSDKIFIFVVLLICVFAVLLFGFIGWNSFHSEKTGEGKEYIYSWQSCTQYSGGKTSYCLKQENFKETRIPIYHSGPFWDFETYRVK